MICSIYPTIFKRAVSATFYILRTKKDAAYATSFNHLLVKRKRNYFAAAYNSATLSQFTTFQNAAM